MEQSGIGMAQAAPTGCAHSEKLSEKLLLKLVLISSSGSYNFGLDFQKNILPQTNYR